MHVQRFKNSFAETIFRTKYAQGPEDTWDALAERVVEDVCGTRWGKDKPLMSATDRSQLTQYIKEQKLIPGGRYLWYAGRGNSYFNNCFLLRAEEDTREEWAELTKRAVSCLMTANTRDAADMKSSMCEPKSSKMSFVLTSNCSLNVCSSFALRIIANTSTIPDKIKGIGCEL